MAKQKPKQDDDRSELLEGQDFGDPTEEKVEAAAGDGAEGAEGTEEVEESAEDAVTGGDEDQAAEGGAEDQTTESSETGSGFLDSLRKLGWEGEDEDEGKTALLDAFQRQASDYQRMEQRQKELEELAEYGNKYLSEQREREKATQQTTQQTETPEGATQGEKPWWSPPKFDPSVLEKYRDITLEEGEPKVGWKANTPREVIQAAEDYQTYLENWATDLVQRPQEVLPKVIEQEFNRLFEARIEERERASRLESFAQEVRETNRDWMYTTDSRGEEVLSAEGKRMSSILSQVALPVEDGGYGIYDPQKQWEVSVLLYDNQNRMAATRATESTSQAASVAEQKRKDHQRRGGQQNRTGTVPKPDEDSQLSQNPNLTPGQALLEQMRLDGIDI